ncbi:MAG: ribosomal-processing cysteine protease Prp [Firmicutes bacterium]|nr:ribosomal-processing cysteine protease Prp [Bacillota bacterium]
MIVTKVKGFGLADLRTALLTHIVISGHAGSAKHGRDLVCAAVSALSINFVNGVEVLCGQDLHAEVSSGWLSVSVPSNECVQQLARSLVFGMSSLSQEYKRFVKMVLEEEVS